MQKKKKKAAQLDSFIPSIWQRGTCYVLMSLQSYFGIVWGCNLRGVVTDPQAQLGYIRQGELLTARNFTARSRNFPSACVLGVCWKIRGQEECPANFRVGKRDQVVGTSQTGRWHRWQTVMRLRLYPSTDFFCLWSLYVFRFKYSTFACINVSALV